MATTNLSAALKEFRELSRKRMEETARKSFMRLGSFIITESPVDTGRFAANWQYAYGAPDSTTTDGDFAGQGEKQAATGRLESTLTDMHLNAVFYMTNSLPYAQRLEYEGHSQQSTRFVTRGVAEWPRMFSEEVAKARAKG